MLQIWKLKVELLAKWDRLGYVNYVNYNRLAQEKEINISRREQLLTTLAGYYDLAKIVGCKGKFLKPEVS